MTLKELRSSVLAAINDEPVLTSQEASAIYAKTMGELDPNRIKWVIEDEAEREEWQEWLVLTAAAKFMESV